MAIRFIDTGFYKSPFVRGLEGALKGLYGYIICDCSAAGIWAQDLEVASIYIGFKISENDFEKNFVAKGKAIFLGNGKYFFPDFIQHQYPKGLQKNNPAHQNIISELLKFKLINEGSLEVLQSPFQGAISNSKGNSNSKGESKSKSKETRVKKNSVVSKMEIIELSPQFQKYEDWAKRNLPDLLEFRQPLENSQLLNLLDEFDKTLVLEKLEAIGNTVGAIKKYKSVYFTCKNWCKLAIQKGWKPTETESGVGQDVWSKAYREITQNLSKKYGQNTNAIQGQID